MIRFSILNSQKIWNFWFKKREFHCTQSMLNPLVFSTTVYHPHYSYLLHNHHRHHHPHHLPPNHHRHHHPHHLPPNHHRHHHTTIFLLITIVIITPTIFLLITIVIITPPPSSSLLSTSSTLYLVSFIRFVYVRSSYVPSAWAFHCKATQDFSWAPPPPHPPLFTFTSHSQWAPKF